MAEARIYESGGVAPILTAFAIEDISVDHRARIQTYQLEDGTVRADEKTLQPIRVTVEGSVQAEDYQPTIGDIEGMLKNRKYRFYRLETRNGVLSYDNLCLEQMPLSEKPEQLDRAHIRLVFKMMMVVDSGGEGTARDAADRSTKAVATKGAY